ncbi:YggT family protein [Curtobacterium sp. MCBD17_013]|uniref:YggT family protein n=1 Tax=unclassified Curtobacterium TaxID=257496 RepID=UPI000DA8589D|nr:MULTISPECIES: YggT family protein [unclassified Curtobacterium]PZF66235.1 YggT family protein [Curtobacterium sp. MCBD17_013]WIB68627.1 YggT family protein [Curtobacterium sp. MCBD17_035]WIE55814.1 YggT family protein [Curtobacterium sp. MCBD17_003]
MVSLVASILHLLLLIYFFMMWARFVLDLLRTFNRSWRPRGAVLVIAEVVFGATDPPVRAVRRVLPPMRMGAVALDFGWSIVMLLVIILMGVTERFAIA